MLRTVFAQDGITVVEEHGREVAPTAEGVKVTTVTGEQVQGQRLLVATGRRASTSGLGLEAAGIGTDARG